MNDKTIVYYTANTEDPELEAKICKNILKHKGDLPVISVSQKPMDFGENICVGDVGHTYFNAYRQMLIGIKAAKTPYIVFAESDFLYPESYFSFEPQGADVYRYNNVWILYKDPRFFSYRRKDQSLGAQIAKREYLINILEKNLEDKPQWSDKEVVFVNKRGYYMFMIPFEFFGGDIACISFKTGKGMRRYTSTMPGRSNFSTKLPYWGYAKDLRKEFLTDEN